MTNKLSTERKVFKKVSGQRSAISDQIIAQVRELRTSQPQMEQIAA